MTTQLDLFAWSTPAPARRKPRATGFRIWQPCVCGSTHSMVFLTDPYNQIALRHWRISAIRPETAQMMAKRHATTGTEP